MIVNKEWASFETEPEMKLIKLNKPYNEIQIKIDDFFKGNEEYSRNELSLILNEMIAQRSENEQLECYHGNYVILPKGKISELLYDDMSNEEKQEYDRKKQLEELDFKICDLKKQLADTDYIITKIGEVKTEEEKAALREKYAEQLAGRKVWRAEINVLEKQLGA